MGIRMRDAAGALKTITRIRMRDAAATLRTIQRIRMRDAGGVLRTVFQYLRVVLSSYSVVGFGSGAASSGLVTSDSTTATPSGGTSPYTYAWTRISGSAAITATAPTAATSAFSATVNEASGGMFATFEVLVTDANSATSTAQVSVELYWTDTR